MRISRISISNHRRVADLDLEVRDHAVLVGPNAAGKSTVLRMLDVLFGATWSQLAGALDPSHFRDATKPMTVEARLEGLDPDDIAHFADKIEVGTGSAAGLSWLTARLVVEMSPIDSDRVEFKRSFVKPMVEDAPVSREDLSQIGWSYLPANRSPDRELGSSRSSAVRSLLQALTLESTEQKGIQDALANLSDVLSASSSLGALRDDLASELTRLFPDPIARDDITIDLPSASIDQPLNDLDVQLTRDGVKSPLTAQSDGLRSLAVIAIQLLARRSARILAVDEPEIHLHPRGQASLGRLLSNAPGQRLVATHAPAVLAQFLPEQAIAVTLDGTRQLPAGSFAGDPKRLQHWWVETALEPLTAERIVLVEGISDRILVKAVARALDLDLDRRGVSVIALNGASNFRPAIRLFGASGFGIRLLGLVDEKEAQIPAAALQVPVADLPAAGIYICHADLEEEYVTAIGVTDVVALLVESGLFSEARILASSSAAKVADISVADLASFVRERKVEAAAAIGESLTTDQATSLTTVRALVQQAVAP